MRQLGELVTATGADPLDAETLAGGLLAMMERWTQPGRRAGASAAKRSLSAGRVGLQVLKLATLAKRRTTAARYRRETARARTDTRTWVMNPREGTRHLIELGVHRNRDGKDQFDRVMSTVRASPELVPLGVDGRGRRGSPPAPCWPSRSGWS